MLKSYGWGGGVGGGPYDFSDNPESKFLFPSLGLDLGLGTWNFDSGLSIPFLPSLFAFKETMKDDNPVNKVRE